MSAKIRLDAHNLGAVINRNIYGHFSEHLGRCIYGGLFVGEDSPIPNVRGMRTDVVEALKHIRVPVLRWPGGCFADEYHWEDGIGPRESRKRMVNTHWGGVVEDNSFGTHEFLELCEQIGCEPYINGNVGSGTVKEMSEWVEYLNSPGDSTVVQRRWANGRKDPWGVKYWGVGNENWGCGGNMRPEYYGDLFRRFNTYCRNYGDNKLYRIACGPNINDWAWMDGVMKVAGRFCDAITLHYYTHPQGWEKKGSATQFDADEYYLTLRKTAYMEELLKGHLAIMDKYDPRHRVGLIVDEWGTWFTVEPGTNPGFLYQQNTMRDAMVAAINLNLFNSHCDRVVMANLAQMVNVLQAVILTDGDQMLLTPTYHVFDLFKAHQDATLLPSEIECGEAAEGVQSITASASVKDSVITVTAANVDCESAQQVTVEIANCDVQRVTARILTGEMHDKNTFEDKENVKIVDFTDFTVTGGGVVLNLPACSVVEVTING
ncbi:MAG: alpha-N-arabinofuranosidase [Clostridia bacterium]|nr:alpha-N-arabinofuranosidase [Clostridia bacterium]